MKLSLTQDEHQEPTFQVICPWAALCSSETLTEIVMHVIEWPNASVPYPTLECPSIARTRAHVDG
jgi:hypothetical protein